MINMIGEPLKYDTMGTNLVFLFADFAVYVVLVASLQVCSDQYSNNDTLK